MRWIQFAAYLEGVLSRALDEAGITTLDRFHEANLEMAQDYSDLPPFRRLAMDAAADLPARFEHAVGDSSMDGALGFMSGTLLACGDIVSPDPHAWDNPG